MGLWCEAHFIRKQVGVVGFCPFCTFLAVRAIESIRTLTDASFITKASISAPSWAFGFTKEKQGYTPWNRVGGINCEREEATADVPPCALIIIIYSILITSTSFSLYHLFFTKSSSKQDFASLNPTYNSGGLMKEGKASIILPSFPPINLLYLLRFTLK